MTASQTAGQSREEKTATETPPVLLNAVPLGPRSQRRSCWFCCFVFNFRWPLRLLPLPLDLSFRNEVYHRARRGEKRTKPVTKTKIMSLHLESFPFPFLRPKSEGLSWYFFPISILYAVLDSAALSQAKKEEEEYQEIYHRGVLHTSFDSPLHLPSILYFSESSGFFKCSLSSCNKQERSGEVCLCVCMLSRFCHV